MALDQNSVLYRLLSSAKFWTTIIGIVVTAFGTWLARFGWDLSDEGLQQVSIMIAGFFAVLLGAQAHVGAGKEKAVEERKTVVITAAASQGIALPEAIALANQSAVVAKPSPPAPKTIVTMLMMAAGIFTLMMFAGCPKPIPGPVAAVIDCAKESQTELVQTVNELKPLLNGERPNWDVIKSDALKHGVNLGMCSLAKIVDLFLAPAPGQAAPAPELAIEARDMFEKARRQYVGNATIMLEGQAH